MSDTSNKNGRFCLGNVDYKNCIFDREINRVALFRSEFYASIALNSIVTDGLDPEHLDWLAEMPPHELELNLCPNPS